MTPEQIEARKAKKRAAAKAWYYRNKEKADESNAVYRRENAAKANESSRLWRKNNPEKARAASDAWAAANPSKIKKIARGVRLRKYGLTEETFAQKLKEQNELCAICCTPSTKKLVVDHCHDSGEFRALLCNNCNMAIGLLKDDHKRMLAAADYIHKHLGLKLKALIG